MDGEANVDVGKDTLEALTKLARAGTQMNRMAPHMATQVLPSLVGVAISAAAAGANGGTGVVKALVDASKQLSCLDSASGDTAAAALLACAAFASRPSQVAVSDEGSEAAAASIDDLNAKDSHAEVLASCAERGAAHGIIHMAASDEGYGHLDACLVEVERDGGPTVALTDDVKLPMGPPGVSAAVQVLLACQLCADALGCSCP